MRLLLIRHGESTANADGRLQGHLDIPLSDRGRRESDLLAERLSRLTIDALYTSTLSRARETAETVANRLGLDVVERPALMERDVGELAGLTRDEIRARYPEYIRARTAGAANVTVAGYESDDDLAQRVMRVLEEIVGDHPRQTVAVVTHGGVIAVACRQTLQMPVARPGPFVVSNAGITTFDMREEDSDPWVRPRAQIVTLNDTCHLDGL
jgi:broad specificity phosphatase PhoE